MKKQKTIVLFAVSFLLFAIDLGCTYNTFAVRGVPIVFEVNTTFRDWVIHDGWAISVGKFTLLKTLLFSLCGWLIFKTRSHVVTFIMAQCSVSNHLIAISSHPTLWWMQDLEMRSFLLKMIAALSLFLTYFGIRYLRARPEEDQALPSSLTPDALPLRTLRTWHNESPAEALLVRTAPR